MSSLQNGEWVLNRERRDDESGDVIESPNELSEKLVAILLLACKPATRAGVLIETQTHIIRQSPLFSKFQSLVPLLSQVTLNGMPTASALAFWLNVHNMLTLHSRVLLADPPRKKHAVVSLQQTVKYRVGGRLYSASDIEIGVLRAACPFPNESPFAGPSFAADDARRAYSLFEHEPRILFALYRGTEGCPPVRVYSYKSIHQDLDEATKLFLEINVYADFLRKEMWIPKLLLWHKLEFGPKDQGIRDIVRRYLQLPMDLVIKHNRHAWEFEMYGVYPPENFVSDTFPTKKGSSFLKRHARDRRHFVGPQRLERREGDKENDNRDIDNGDREKSHRRSSSDRDGSGYRDGRHGVKGKSDKRISRGTSNSFTRYKNKSLERKRSTSKLDTEKENKKSTPSHRVRSDTRVPKMESSKGMRSSSVSGSKRRSL